MRDDISASMQKFNIKTLGNKKGVERIEGILWEEEEVLYIAPTNAMIHSVNTKKKEKFPGIFAVTDRRIVFSYKAGFSEMTETFELSEVETVNSSGNGLTGGRIAIHTRTKTIEILVTYKKEVMKEIQDVINKAVNACKSGNTVSSGGKEDSLSQIEKLYDFLQQGIITEEEFEIKKKQLLGL